MDCMDKTELELWLDRTLEDENWAFQSMLFHKLDKNDEFDEQKEKQDFLDIRANRSFYTLNMNPKGTVNIKITRDANNKITGIAYMTEAEVTELLEDMSDDDDWTETVEGKVWHPRIIPVNYETMADGEIVWLGEYTLSEGDRIWYNVLAEAGNGLQVGFAKPGDPLLNTTYYSVKNLRQEGEALEISASFTFKTPVKPGTHKLEFNELHCRFQILTLLL